MLARYRTFELQVNGNDNSVFFCFELKYLAPKISPYTKGKLLKVVFDVKGSRQNNLNFEGKFAVFFKIAVVFVFF